MMLTVIVDMYRLKIKLFYPSPILELINCREDNKTNFIERVSITATAADLSEKESGYRISYHIKHNE